MMDAERLRRAVWRPPWSCLEAVVEGAGSALSVAVYVVGGTVRDLLRGREPRDLDLVVVGDGLAFAQEIGTRLEVPVTLSRRFLTAELEIPDCGRVDVSTARRESYPTPGALPEVEAAGIEEDLRRRDFTINTFTLGLCGEVARGVLADPRAEADLRDGWLRVLHGASFEDDPTRILRGVALELRLGFRLDDESERLARASAQSGAFAAVSGQRLWQELERLLDAEPVGAVARLDGLGLLGAISPDLRFDDTVRRRLAGALELRERLSRLGPVGEGEPPVSTALLALAWDLDEAARSRLARRLALPNRYRGPLVGGARGIAAWLADAPSLRPSEIHERLARLALAELAMVGWSAGAAAVEAVERELGEWRRLRLSIGAADLLERGIESGPAVGRALDATLRARLDGRIAADEELDYALQRVR